MCINDKNATGCSGSSANALAAGGQINGSLQANKTYYVRVDGDNNATGTFQLTLTVEPQAPTLNLNSADPYTKIDASWPDVNAAAGYTVYWRKSGTTGYSSASVAGAGTTIASLQPGSLYNVWTLNRCTSAQTFYSPLSSATTSIFTSCGAAPVLSCGTAANTSLQITWPQIPGSIRYDIYYRKVGAAGYSISNNVTVTNSGGISSFTINGLLAGTQYQIWIYVYCSASYSIQSNTVTCTTTGTALRPLAANNDVYSFSYKNIDYVDVRLEEQNIPVEIPESYNSASVEIADGRLVVRPYNTDQLGIVSADLDGLYIGLEPNIANNESNLTIVSPQGKDAVVSVMAINGQLVKQFNVELSNGRTVYPIDLNNLAQGIYLVSVKTEDGLQTRKLIIAR
jgi:hypothetical protein